MKEFFQRHNVRIEVADLNRFARVMIDDLRLVLGGYEFVVRLLDSDDLEKELNEDAQKAMAENRIFTESGTNKIHLPVVFQDSRLALITATPPEGRALSEAVFPLVPALIRLSLEKILMYKINITDQETGLNNEDYFRTYLSKHLEEAARGARGRGRLKPLSLGDAGEHPGLSVLLAEIEHFGKLTADYGRLEAAKALSALARWLKDKAPSPSCLARLDRGRLGLVLPHQDLETAEDLSREVCLKPGLDEEKGRPKMKLAFGLANWPLDFADEKDPTDAGESNPAELLMSKAELALRQALTSKDESVFSFRDVLHRGGRVVQVLPYGRVVLNLGRVVGARAGQVFTLGDAGKADEVDYKGEVVLFDVREDFSLGEVINLGSSISRVRPGDVLILNQAAREELALADRPPEESRDPLLGIPDHQGFVRQMSERIKGCEAFGIVLLRIDDFDRYRTTIGHLETDRHFKALFDLLGEDLPREALVGRFSTESLVVFLAGFDQAGALALAETWRDKIGGRLHQTSSFGVAVFPRGPFDPGETLTNAQKALEHASFLGPASAAAFDSVSLNISGDKLFEAGDVEGAVEEYNRALELNPADLNVLNSLGVCYGYQSRPDLALETFDRALKADPQNMMAHYNRGFAYAMAGRPEEALESFRRAARIDEGNFDVLFQLGKAALDLDLVEEALESFKKAAGLKDHQPIVFRYLGQTLLRAGRPEKAIGAFKAAARHDPYDAPSLSQLGVLYMDRGTDLDVALSLTTQSVDLDQTNNLFRQRKARALALVGNLEEAEAEYKRAMDMGARTREVFLKLGRVVLDQGRPEEAREWFKESLAVDQEYGPARDALEGLEK